MGQYRFALESFTIDLAMKNNPEELVKNLLGICEQMEARRNDGDMDAYLKLDNQYHEAIFSYSGNYYFEDGYRLVSGKSAALRKHLSHPPTHIEKSFRKHFEIAELLREEKIDAAKAVLEQHVTRGQRSYADTVKDIAKADKKAGLTSKK